MFQQIQRAVQAIAAQFIGIAEAHAQLRIGFYQRHKSAVDRRHRRTRFGRGGIAPRQIRYRRHFNIDMRQRMIALAHAFFVRVIVERMHGHFQQGRIDEQTLCCGVE